MTILRLLADDLTGALDSAAQFTGAFGPLPVVLRPTLAPPAGSFVLDLACRDQAQDEAVALTAATAHYFEGGDIAFKKIDSLLRGHWAAELAALATMGLFRRIVLAPAFPGQGRITRSGRQLLLGPDGTSTVLPIDPRAEVALHGLNAVVLSGGDAPAGDAPLLLCDAASDDDLRRLVRSAGALRGPTLWCGAAGLALALTDGRPPPETAPRPGPHLMVIGSDHVVTREQILCVGKHAPNWIVRFGEDASASADRINRSLSLHGRGLCLADLPAGCARAEASDLIARWFGAMAPRITKPTTLTVVGGETFASLCRVLQIDILLVEGEWQAGVPASRSMQGLWAETACFSKSGAFGEPDCLLRLLGQS
ncbi:four-carbon acid sugar kinase family protein [Lichenifustis flavocetrariae]|uniref:Four-carbon acid sugar kinase family protein n=1 Tax=Lichenifustis flavocetrariae TaxID=2949735 RepID=A0AA41YUD7_9HYPH|nr:four-carbon acid sugar kinase family protein [Lichenifustis flavocetrariae]MCW6508751.1 four-carbon acid sugar kinase family protein [Lichenifustis flavocetrariae]